MLTWIKNHPAQTAVVALSFSLAASSVELYRERSSTRLSKGAHDSRPPAAGQIAAAEYRITQHAITGHSRAEAEVRSLMELLRQNLEGLEASRASLIGKT